MNKMKGLALIMGLIWLAACGGSAENPATPAVVEQTRAGAVTGAQTTPPSAPTVVPTLPPPVIVNPADQGGTPVAEARPQPVAPWPADRFGYGAQSHATIGDPAFTMTVMHEQLGLDWVKVQMRWADVQASPDTYYWDIWDSVLREAQNHALHVLLSVVTAPEWTRAAANRAGPPDDNTLYNNFLTALLTRYPGQIHAIEVWNEQNIDREWTTPNGLSPLDYVNFLAGAYQTIKSIDPTIIVISGALSPTGIHDFNRVTSMDDFIYLDEALAAGMLDYADCVGAHHNGYNLPPDVGWEEVDRAGSSDGFIFKGPWANPHHSWSFKSTVDIYADKVQAIDASKKVCVTEFGWGSSEGYDTFPAGFEFFQDNSLEKQAAYIVQAFQQMHDSGRVWLAFLFNYDYGNKGNGPTDDAVPYSLITLDGSPRPAFFAVAEMEKRP